MKFVDCKGLVCPMPLIETKKAIKESMIGDEIVVIVDNDTSFNNVSHFLKDNGLQFSFSKQDTVYQIKFEVKELKTKNVEHRIENTPKILLGNHSIILSSNLMGSGNEELGKLLLKGFINTLEQLETLPKEIICYNSGVTLATKGSDTAKVLKVIEKKGVKILLCGTCVDFFGLKDNLEVGSITNMLYIAEKLTSKDVVVIP